MDESMNSTQDDEQLRLSDAARRYKDFTEISRDWYWEMDEHFQFTYFSKEFEETTGLSLTAILGKTRWESLGLEEYGEVDWEGHKHTLMQHKAFHGFEYHSRKLPGGIFWFRTSGKPRFDDNGNFLGYFGIASEITAFKRIEDQLRETNAEQKKLIEELEKTKDELTQSVSSAAISRQELEKAHQELEQKHRELSALSEELHKTSITDPLTGAYNRRYFLESTTKTISLVKRHHCAFSLLMLDIDHFKKINDTYGHMVGDKVLQTLTEIWKEELRDEDVFARFGGEEFVVALANTDLAGATMVAERLRTKLLNYAIEVEGKSLHITVSTGVSQYEPTEESIQETIKRADEALYAAKNGGRNQVVAR